MLDFEGKCLHYNAYPGYPNFQSRRLKSLFLKQRGTSKIQAFNSGLDRLRQALVDRSQDREVNFPMPEWVETQIYAA